MNRTIMIKAFLFESPMHARQWIFSCCLTFQSPHIFTALLLGLLLGPLTATAQPQALLNSADSLYESGHYAASVARLDTFIAAYPSRRYDLGEAYWKRSLNYLALGRINQAKADNKESAKLRKGISPADLGKNEWLWAQIHLAEDKPLQALQRTRRADAYPYLDNPTMPASIAMARARALLAMDAPESALSAASAAQEIVEIIEGPDAPLLADIFQLRGQVLSQQKQWGAAAEAFKAALARSDRPELRLWLGNAQWRQGAVDEAERNLREAQEKGLPKTALLASLKLAELELGARDFSGALAHLETAGRKGQPAVQARGGEAKPAENVMPPQSLSSLERLRARAWLLQPAIEGRLKAWAAAQRGAAALSEAVNQAYGQPSTMQALQPEWALFEHGLEALFALQEDPAYEKDVTAQAFEWVQQAERTRFQARWQGQRQPLAGIAMDSLQALLPPSTTRLVFYEGASAVFGLALNAENAQLAKLDKQALLSSGDNLVLALRERDSRGFIVHSQATYQALIGPFEALLKKQRQLELYLPDGLAFLPVDALLTEAPRLRRRIRFHRYGYLGAEFNLAFLSQPAARPASPATGGFIRWIGVSPDFSTGSAATQLAPEAALKAKMYQYGISTPEGQILPLATSPSAVLEAAGALPDKVSKQLFATPMPAAAWDTLLQADTEAAAMLYLNLPFFFNKRLPFQSGWVGGGDSGSPWIYLSEINKKRSKNALYILPTAPAEYYSLARQATGAPAYFPPPTTNSMGNWYGIVGKYPLETGMQRVIKTLLKDKTTAAPWHWAGAKLYP